MTRKKRWLILMAVILLVHAFALTAFAAENEPSLVIQNRSVSLDSAIYMNFKVVPKGVPKENISLLVWTTPQNEYTKGTEDRVLHSDGTDSKGREVFVYKDIDSRKMTDVIYARAYANVGDKEIYSDPVGFSVTEYAYRIGKLQNQETLQKVIHNMLRYGARAQRYFQYHLDFLATDTVYEIQAVNAKFSNGLRESVFKAGSSVLITADTPTDGMIFSHFENGLHSTIGTENSLLYTIQGDDTVTAIYRNAGSEPIPIGKLAYTPNPDGLSCTVTGIGTYQQREIYIPSAMDGYAVTAIGDGAFQNSTATAIVLPPSVTKIGNDAFSGCSSLTEMRIPATVTSIGNHIFSNCTTLKTVYYQAAFEPAPGNSFLREPSIKHVVFEGDSIPRYICDNCSNLETVTITDSVKQIGSQMESFSFAGCTGLREIVIPSGVTEIGSHAFENCTALTSVILPKELQSVREAAFKGCGNLERLYYCGDRSDWGILTVDPANTVLTDAARYYYTEVQPTALGNYWHYTGGIPTVWNRIANGWEYQVNQNGTCTVYGRTTTDAAVSLPSIIERKTVTEIAAYAFMHDTDMTSIRIPDTVEVIGESAFNGCNSLTAIQYGGTEEQWKQIRIAGGNDVLSSVKMEYTHVSSNETLPVFARFDFGTASKAQDMGWTSHEYLVSAMTYNKSYIAVEYTEDTIIVYAANDYKKGMERNAFAICFEDIVTSEFDDLIPGHGTWNGAPVSDKYVGVDGYWQGLHQFMKIRIKNPTVNNMMSVHWHRLGEGYSTRTLNPCMYLQGGAPIDGKDHHLTTTPTEDWKTYTYDMILLAGIGREVTTGEAPRSYAEAVQGINARGYYYQHNWNTANGNISGIQFHLLGGLGQGQEQFTDSRANIKMGNKVEVDYIIFGSSVEQLQQYTSYLEDRGK